MENTQNDLTFTRDGVEFLHGDVLLVRFANCREMNVRAEVVWSSPNGVKQGVPMALVCIDGITASLPLTRCKVIRNTTKERI